MSEHNLMPRGERLLPGGYAQLRERRCRGGSWWWARAGHNGAVRQIERNE